MTDLADYTLCYSHEDGKFHKGLGCSEEKEKFIGEITDQIVPISGYKGNGRRLLLEDFHFSTSADIGIFVPDGTCLKIRKHCSILVESGKEHSNVGVLYTNGELTIEGDEASVLDVRAITEGALWSRAICARAGNITVNSGTVIAAGGKCSRASCGFYAGGRLWIEIGDKGVIRFQGGRVVASGYSDAVRAGEGRLIVAPGASINNALQAINTDAEWKGDQISALNPELPVTIAFTKQ